MPTAAHFIYIPVVLLIGVVIGWILGGRATRDALAMEQRRKEARLLRRQRAQQAEDAPAPPADDGGAT